MRVEIFVEAKRFKSAPNKSIHCPKAAGVGIEVSGSVVGEAQIWVEVLAAVEIVVYGWTARMALVDEDSESVVGVRVRDGTVRISQEPDITMAVVTVIMNGASGAGLAY